MWILSNPTLFVCVPTLARANHSEQNLAWTINVPRIDRYDLQFFMRDKVGSCRSTGTQLRLCATMLARVDHIQFEPRVLVQRQRKSKHDMRDQALTRNPF